MHQDEYIKRTLDLIERIDSFVNARRHMRNHAEIWHNGLTIAEVIKIAEIVQNERNADAVIENLPGAGRGH